MAKQTDKKTQVRPRLRVGSGPDIALGPGKAELLDLVHQFGSITKAAGRMKMSYMRAWSLIRTMNRCFKEPLVVAKRGGSKGGGGAELTDTGIQALALYRRMDAKCLAAIQPEWELLKPLLRE